MSDTPRTSAWWRAHFQGHLMTDSDCLQLINQIAADDEAPLDLEALAESERLRMETLDALNRANDATTREETRADNAEAQAKYNGATADASAQHLLAEIQMRTKAEGDLAGLRATFERTVAAWKIAEMAWNEERKELEAKRDDYKLYYDMMETCDADRVKYLKIRELRNRIESRRSK